MIEDKGAGIIHQHSYSEFKLMKAKFYLVGVINVLY